jgi:hypothetical protein
VSKDHVSQGYFGRSANGMSWMVLFLFTNMAAALSASLRKEPILPRTGAPGERGSVLLAIGMTGFICLGYFSWIYAGLFGRLTQANGFSGRTARLFLGGLLDSTVPRQAVVIGPKRNGKTAFTLAREPGTNFESGRTTHRSFFASSDDRDSAQVAVTTIDTPGENLGDHIMVTARYRADSLVLVLNPARMDPVAVRAPDNYTIALCHKLFQKDSTEWDYLQALDAATRRSGRGDLYQAESFMLYLNAYSQGSDDQILASIAKAGQVYELACQIGYRFEVSRENCCVMVGNGIAAGVGRNLLASEPADRIRAAADAWKRYEYEHPGPQATPEDRSDSEEHGVLAPFPRVLGRALRRFLLGYRPTARSEKSDKTRL